MDRKSVSPIIAIVLLLMMTVAVAGAVYFWLTGTQSRMQKAAGGQVEKMTKAAGYSFEIVYSECYNVSEDASVEVRIRNTGTSKIKSGTEVLATLSKGGTNIGQDNETIDNTLDSNDLSGIINFTIADDFSNDWNEEYGLSISIGQVARKATVNCTS